MSTMAKQARRARVKWVTSQIQIRFGSQANQSGHGFFAAFGRGGRSGTTSP